MDDFDIRIKRITERHEALAQSLELMQHEITAMKEGIALLFRSTENLLETARIHEGRLGRLEGGD